MYECPICFSSSGRFVSCFGKCHFECCLTCFTKILKLNSIDCIEYNCPNCRHQSIKNRDRRFTNFINHNNKIQRSIIQLYETKIQEDQQILLSLAWNEFINTTA